MMEKHGQILSLREEGKTIRRIANLTKVPESTVKYHLYSTSPRIPMKRGRPSKLSSEDEHALKKRARRRKFDTSKHHNAFLQKRRGVSVTSRTVRGHLLKMGLISKNATSKPKLNYRQRQQRLNFAQQELGTRDWKRVLFVDEATFSLSPHKRKVRAYKGEIVIREKVKFPPKINVWAGVCWYGKTEIVIFKENLDGAKYESIIVESMLPAFQSLLDPPWILQQDRDPKHSSRRCRNALARNDIEWLLQPAQSPDLNVMENVWAIMKNRVDQHSPQTIDDLRDWVNFEWNNLNFNDFLPSILSMNERCQAVIDANGGNTDY